MSFNSLNGLVKWDSPNQGVKQGQQQGQQQQQQNSLMTVPGLGLSFG